MKNDKALVWARFSPVGVMLWIFMSLSGGELRAADPFAEGVRSTPPLTPEEERRAFHLPPGFEIQLVAAEPDIFKPMNLAFDEKGRLWVTDSLEYPFPAPLDRRGRDSIKMLEDLNGDGRADRITTFADGLNIPIGIYPYQGGVIAWSIPNIWRFRDTDQDGKADQREVLFGPLGWERDTHGNNASFRRGFDGWLYATHGFNNNTTVRGRDGSEIRMNSGNTYRVRLDGSRVEQHTWGQVNPFGLSFDSLGNLYSADCHSSPIYELLRGAYYPSFGKPHDGLGFGPVLMQHSHGSTAIAGVLHYEDDGWPAEYRNNIFVGNVMTSRVNRDSLIENGASKTAREEPDFISTDDPWFRPVDLQLGPDGAMYIADFYNRIIGHYEVPLKHPGRDRERGRIWRVVYKGTDSAGLPAKKLDLSQSAIPELISVMGESNLTRRMLAMNQLTDRIGEGAARPVRELISSGKANRFQVAHGLWVLHRLGGLDLGLLASAGTHSDRLVRTHVMRVLSEIQLWNEQARRLAIGGLEDREAIVQRAAADAIGQHPAFEHVGPLLKLRQRVPAADDHLLHTVRMALRNQLKDEPTLAKVAAGELTEADLGFIADVAPGIPSAEAGKFLLRYAARTDLAPGRLGELLKHAARYVEANGTGEIARLARSRFGQDLDLQLALFKSVQDGVAQRGGPMAGEVREWGKEMAVRLLEMSRTTRVEWVNSPVNGVAVTTNPWVIQERSSADGDKGSAFLSSLPPGGESLTGILRSRAFKTPDRLSFFVAGHDGPPERPAQKRNAVRLRDLRDQSVLVEAFAPRNDTAQKVEWDLAAFSGREVYLEVVDGDTGGAFAWLAIGRIEPAVVAIPKVSPNRIALQQTSAAELARTLGLTEVAEPMEGLLGDASADLNARAAAARALAGLKSDPTLSLAASLVGDTAVTAELRRRICDIAAHAQGAEGITRIVEAMSTAPYRAQVRLAESMASNTAGAEKLLDLVSGGKASPRLLLEASVRDKLAAAKPVGGPERIRTLTERLPELSQEAQQLIESRRAAFALGQANAANGARVYATSCAVCHRIEGQGGLVGPQLDGIGGRGLERLLEDVLDPNRNVDRAFRTHVITLKDGEIVVGLPRREEGEVLVLADATGKENSVPKKQIQERVESETSLMPGNFGEILAPADFNDLIAYLLSKAGSAP